MYWNEEVHVTRVHNSGLKDNSECDMIPFNQRVNPLGFTPPSVICNNQIIRTFFRVRIIHRAGWLY
jgi:hypothetical protein